MSTTAGDDEQQECVADEGSKGKRTRMARAMGTVTRVAGEQQLRGLVCWGGCCRMAPLLLGKGGRGGEGVLPL